ncbi:hypothetical protein RIF29_29287 [Crotalaria pallida]|uniref:Uncharacterized protein n=1 Tax=Crotalaria pallida TaxID=3830 RepID=A0AAN9HTR9_CROPI
MPPTPSEPRTATSPTGSAANPSANRESEMDSQPSRSATNSKLRPPDPPMQHLGNMEQVIILVWSSGGKGTRGLNRCRLVVLDDWGIMVALGSWLRISGWL